MKTLLIIFLIGLTPFKEPTCLQLDLLLVGDMSYSVSGNEGFVADAFAVFVDRFELSDQEMQIGVMTFNSNPLLISSLTDNKTELLQRISTIKTTPANHNTNLAVALQGCLEHFSTNGRQGFHKMIILVSDGDADDKTNARIIADQLNQIGIRVCGILINDSSSNPTFMKSICGDCYVETNYNTLIEEVKKFDICL